MADLRLLVAERPRLSFSEPVPLVEQPQYTGLCLRGRPVTRSRSVELRWRAVRWRPERTLVATLVDLTANRGPTSTIVLGSIAG